MALFLLDKLGFPKNVLAYLVISPTLFQADEKNDDDDVTIDDDDASCVGDLSTSASATSATFSADGSLATTLFGSSSFGECLALEPGTVDFKTFRSDLEPWWRTSGLQN